MKKKIIFFILVLFVVLPYQNCSPVNFLSINSSVLDLKSDNNGTGYGGKPDYYRFVPDFTCESKVSPVSSLHITDTQATLAENKKIACGAVTTNLDPHLIDTSIYQSEIVGYQEGIYEGESTAPEAIPANLVEVWCRDQKDESGIETITHFNRTTQEAVTRIYYSKPVTNKNQTINQHQEISDFSVARILSFNRVTIQDKQNFDLKVFRDQPAADLGLFKGEMNAVIEGQKVHRDTFCRLGGSVDPKLWPVAQIVDLNVGKLKIAPDFSSFSFLSGITNPIKPNLFSVDLSSQNIKQIGTQFADRTVEDFYYSLDSKSLFYWGNPTANGGFDLLNSDLKGTNSVRINDQVLPDDPKSFNLATISADGKTIFYELGSPASGFRMLLKSVPVGGGSPTTISPSFFSGSNFMGTFDFAISNSARRVAFLGGYLLKPDLYISDFDGANLIKVNIVLPDSDFYLLADTGIVRPSGANGMLQIPHGGNVILTHAYKYIQDIGFDRYDYLVSIDGLQISRLPLNWTWTDSSLSGKKHLIYDSLSHFNLYDLASGARYELPQVSYPFFAQDLLVGTQTLSNGQLDAVAISTDNGQISSLCSGAAGSAVQILAANDGRLFVASYDSQNQILNVFEKKPDANCVKKSAMPMTGSMISAMSLSPDGQKLLVRFKIIQGNLGQEQLIYIPLNGRPPVLVNSPVYFGAWIWDAFFSSDSASIVYYGPQIKPGESSVFLWKLPADGPP